MFNWFKRIFQSDLNAKSFNEVQLAVMVANKETFEAFLDILLTATIDSIVESPEDIVICRKMRDKGLEWLDMHYKAHNKSTPGAAEESKVNERRIKADLQEEKRAKKKEVETKKTK